MTIKEATLKSLEDIGGLANHKAVLKNIIEKGYCDVHGSKTPELTISATLGDLIRNGDARVKRISEPGATFSYYLTKNEDKIKIESQPAAINGIKKIDNQESFNERALHKLLSTYLITEGILSKTIFHEKSKSSVDPQQKWVHPDMLGVKLLKLATETGQTFRKAISKSETFKLYSYELKKIIRHDYELKQAYFQAVSNSSWANYGYLVAFEIDGDLYEEMKRLNQSFGIGIINLKANPFETKVLFQATPRNLDFTTIDKLCKINTDFNDIIEHIEKLLTAGEKYVKSTENELTTFCDPILANESEIEAHCKDNHIPIEPTNEG